MALERLNRAFTGIDPEGDEKLRQGMQEEWERESTLSEIKKALPKGTSPLTSIQELLKGQPKNGHPQLENPPFVVVGIQRVDPGDNTKRKIYLSSSFDDKEAAKKYTSGMRYSEFSIHKEFFSLPNRGYPDFWVEFFVVDLNWLRDRENLPKQA